MFFRFLVCQWNLTRSGRWNQSALNIIYLNILPALIADMTSSKDFDKYDIPSEHQELLAKIVNRLCAISPHKYKVIRDRFVALLKNTAELEALTLTGGCQPQYITSFTPDELRLSALQNDR